MVQAIKRVLVGFVLLAAVIAGLLYVEEAREAPAPKYSVTQVSPVVIEKLVKEIKLETASRPFIASFDLEREKEFRVLGFHVGTVPLEWGTFIANGIASAGFPEGSIHIDRLAPDFVELSLDAPKLLHLEKKVHTVAHGGPWKELNFHDEAHTKAEALLREAACKSTLLQEANESAKERVPALFAAKLPSVKVVVHTTEPTAC